MPVGLLSQAGDRQCSLSELGRGFGGNQQSHQRTCRKHRQKHARARVMRGGGQQHEQYPAGPGWALALLVESIQLFPLHAPAWHHHPQPHLPGSGQPHSLDPTPLG